MTHIFFLFKDTKSMYWLWLFAIIILLLFLLSMLPIWLNVKALINIDKKKLTVNLKLLNLIPILNLVAYLTNDQSIYTKINKKTKTTKFTDLKLQKPKHMFLLKAIKIKKLNVDLKVNLLKNMQQKNAVAIALVPILFTAGAIYCGHDKKGKFLWNSTDADTSVLLNTTLTTSILSIVLNYFKNKKKQQLPTTA